MKSERSLSGLDNGSMETKDLPAKSISDTTQAEMHGRHSVHHALQTGLEKQAVPSNPVKELTRYPLEESGLAPRTEEKNSDNLQPTEGQLMDKLPLSQGFVLVASQHGMLPSVHHASTIQSMTNPRDVVTMATSLLSQSIPMGKTVLSILTLMVTIFMKYSMRQF